MKWKIYKNLISGAGEQVQGLGEFVDLPEDHGSPPPLTPLSGERQHPLCAPVHFYHIQIKSHTCTEFMIQNES